MEVVNLVEFDRIKTQSEGFQLPRKHGNYKRRTMSKNKMEKILINGLEVTLKGIGEATYISLTDMARLKNPEFPAEVIINWMSNKNSFDFYCLWEELSNPNFNLAESHQIKIDEVGFNAFTMTPSQWKKRTNAIGIVPSAGKYSVGTFAHPDIAMEFATWLDTRFKLYLVKEFQRLKSEEQKAIGWSAKRELAKINYRIQTDSIAENLIPKDLTVIECGFVYATEADRINKALFGHTAGEWRSANSDKEGNVRDYASVEQLLVLANMESLNAELIRMGLQPSDRTKQLNEVAIRQMKSLMDNGDIKRLQGWSEKKLLLKNKN